MKAGAVQVAVVDYGMGNLNSVAKALENLRAEVVVTADAREIGSADRLILPGVGAFGRGMENLGRLDGMVEALTERVFSSRTPILGICLGMQLFAQEGWEHGRHLGLGWIHGTVRPLERAGEAVKSIHIGWADVLPRDGSALFAGLGASPSFYFDHRYHLVADEHVAVSAVSHYGTQFAAAVQRDNIFGVQFHPEKSQETGMGLLRNFLHWEAGCDDAPGALAADHAGSVPKVRIVPTLCLHDGRLVKTIRFERWRDVGDPVKAAAVYDAQVADELVYVDMHASRDGRGIERLLDVIPRVVGESFMPLTAGGGIRSLDDIRRLLQAGADKVVVNSHAAEHPEFLPAAARAFGSQCIVVSVDARRSQAGRYEVFTHSATRATGLEPAEWARHAAALGAGELLLTAVDRDGTMQGYDLEVIRRVAAAVDVPVVASGGAGRCQDLADAVRLGGASAVAAASLFHFTDQSPIKAKAFLRRSQVPVR